MTNVIDVHNNGVDGNANVRTSLEVAPQASEKTQQTPKEDAQEPLHNNQCNLYIYIVNDRIVYDNTDDDDICS